MSMRMLFAGAVMAVTLAGCEETTTTTRVVETANRDVQIVNQTGRTIYRFYGSNVGTNSWEEDILGSSVLGNGQSVNIDFNDGTGHCNFDLKAEFQDGSSVVQNNINVCRVSQVVVR